MSVAQHDVTSLTLDSRTQAIALRAGVVSQGGELHFRGGRAGEVLFTIDGIPVRDPLAGGNGAALAGGSDVALNGLSAPDIHLRALFSPIAFFAGAIITDENGFAAITVRLPDNLTRYRIIAVAAAGADRFGLGESLITARVPLMIRPSPPRFLNAGDHFELPVIIENRTAAPVTARVGVRGTNATFTDGRARSVRVISGRRVEVRFPMSADAPGTMTVQAAVASGVLSDAGAISIPVYTPATSEAFATYGDTEDAPAFYDVRPPADIHAAFGGLDVSVSSTALQSLSDAVLYLMSYPYECTEQKAARLMGVLSLRDVLHSFGVPGLPDSAEVNRAIRRDLRDITAVQAEDGGFPFWAGREPYPWLGVFVPRVLGLALEKGYPVPEEVMENSIRYLKEIEYRPLNYPGGARTTIEAHAIRTLSGLGYPDVQRARRLVERVGLKGLSPEAAAWLLEAIAAEDDGADLKAQLERTLFNRITEKAGLAHVVTGTTEGDHLILHSEMRTDAAVLGALLAARPESSVLPKLARGLLANRRNGRWGSTQENGFVLEALDRYFRARESVEPAFEARCWLGDAFAGSFRFAGRTTETQELRVPMSALIDMAGAVGPGSSPPAIPVTLDKTGPGRLYYRLGLRYAPRAALVDPKDAGFVVSRTYEPLDDPGDVRRDAKGVWHVRAGARVQVVVTMLAPDVRYHVALVDPLPAGFEPLNPVFRGVDLSDTQRSGWWYEHQNLRSERAEAFTTHLREGTHTFSYVARATTPGTFIAPAPKAEEMYAPETWGRGASDRVMVEAKR